MILSPEDADLFYRLMWPLQHFVNQKLGILPPLAGPQEYSELSESERLLVRNALWERVDLIDEFLAANPAKLSDDEAALVLRWKSRISGDFLIERFLKRGAIFISAERPARAYLALALYETFDEVLFGQPLPIYTKAVLLPFRGRIIYDGMLEPYSVILGPGYRASLRDVYLRAKQRGEINETLEAQVQLAKPAPARPRPGPDLISELDRIVAAADKLKAPGEPVHGAALALLKASARLAQNAVRDERDLAALADLTRSLQRAWRRLDQALERASSADGW